MYVKRITPKKLPAGLTFILKNLYHADLSKFIAIVDVSKSTLFVNKTVLQKDIDGFLEVITFPDYWVADEESGKGQFLEHVYREYGEHTYRALLDAHTWQMEQKEKRQAAETAKKIIPLIEKEINNENLLLDIMSGLLMKFGMQVMGLTGEHLKMFPIMAACMSFILGIC